MCAENTITCAAFLAEMDEPARGHQRERRLVGRGYLGSLHEGRARSGGNVIHVVPTSGRKPPRPQNSGGYPFGAGKWGGFGADHPGDDEVGLSTGSPVYCGGITPLELGTTSAAGKKGPVREGSGVIDNAFCQVPAYRCCDRSSASRNGGPTIVEFIVSLQNALTASLRSLFDHVKRRFDTDILS